MAPEEIAEFALRVINTYIQVPIEHRQSIITILINRLEKESKSMEKYLLKPD